MGKKKTRGDVLKSPVHRTREKEAFLVRKMSELIKEMAGRLLRKPEDVPSLATDQTTVLLASAAWNFASGYPNLRGQHRAALEQLDWEGAAPWAELLSSDTDQLIAGLVEYKRAHHPNDRRRIVAAGMTPAGNLRVEWVDEAMSS